MAGGIDWFRWHHGSVTDPKFPLIARRADARLGDVIAVWAFVLEQASAADERGVAGEIDCEAVDCMLDAHDGTTQRILAAMEARGLLADGVVCKWSKRQPKREDETANERKRRQREREHAAAMAESATSQSDVTRRDKPDVTQCHADVTAGHARGEERREEKKRKEEKGHAQGIPHAQACATEPEPVPTPSPAGLVCRAMKRQGIADVSPGHTVLLQLIEAGATEDEFIAAAQAAVKAGKGFAYALGTLRGWRADAAKSAANGLQGPMPAAPTETAYQRSMRERAEEACPGIARKPPGHAPPAANVIDAAQLDFRSNLLTR